VEKKEAKAGVRRVLRPSLGVQWRRPSDGRLTTAAGREPCWPGAHAATELGACKARLADGQQILRNSANTGRF
jgi:hypothetical protein